MIKDLFWITVASSIVIVLGLLVVAFWPNTKGNVVVVKYDCSQLIGGWHPDIPLKVQEQCRKRELNK
jgi:hypothetical protein